MVGSVNADPPKPFVPSEIKKITLDFNTMYQQMDGFGGSDCWRVQFVGKNWPLEKREKIADLLFSQELDERGNPKGIGLSVWRFNIGAGSMEQGSGSNISDEWRRTECFLNADGSYNWTKQEGQLWFMMAAKKRGVEKLLGFTNSPPVFYTKNGKAYSPGGYQLNLKQGYIARFADFLTTVCQHFMEVGLPLDYLSPVNEPQWDWKAGKDSTSSQEGSPASNADIAELTRNLSSGLAQKNLSTRVVVGEAGSIAYLYSNSDAKRGNQVEEFFNPSSGNYIGDLPNVYKVISGHSYFTVWPITGLIENRAKLASKLSFTDKNLKYWESEYCVLEGANKDIDGGGTRDLSMKTALYIARIIHTDLTVANASSWQWWTALTRVDYKDGLVYLDNGDHKGAGGGDAEYCRNDGQIRDSKTLWALGNYSLFIRPGMVRIFSSADGTNLTSAYGLMVSAYKDPVTQKLVMVAINNGSSDCQFSLEIKGGTLVDNEMAVYETSNDKNLQHLDSEKITAMLVPAKSIRTFVGVCKQ
jgi:O-glycosyl hydrolase